MKTAGGVKGGQNFGQTSARGEELEANMLKSADPNATIAYGLGVSTDRAVMSPSLRPFKVAHKGKPVTSLFS